MSFYGLINKFIFSFLFFVNLWLLIPSTKLKYKKKGQKITLNNWYTHKETF